ncbi:MAG: ABC transporter permease [Vicinamibacteria bacterium]|nr:ABC transporter permease [Vicinamibacteria bacterium]
MNDVRHGLRANLKLWPSSLIIVLLLGLGIGATVSMVSMDNAMRFRPLPFDRPEALVALRETHKKQGRYSASVSWPSYRDLERDNRVFSEMGAYQRRNFNVGGGVAEAENVRGTRVTSGLFPMLGVAPALGRTFQEHEIQPDSKAFVLISDSLWETRFGRDPNAVGRVLRINDVPHVVLGVMPPKFAFPEFARLWVPLAKDETQARRDSRAYEVIGRLDAGVTLAEAQARIDAIATEHARLYPSTNAGWGIRVWPLREELLPSEAIAGTGLSGGAVFFILAITCANVSLLLLGRYQARARESAVRLALGATRVKLTRRFLIESLLLALIGGFIGLPLSVLGARWVVMAIPTGLPYWLSFELSPITFVLASVITLAAALMAGLTPALRSSSLALVESLKDESRSSTAGGRSHWLRQVFATAQFALSFVLLVGALLLTLSFVKIRSFAHGFDPRQVLTMRFALRGEIYAYGERRMRFVEDALRGVSALPGVAHASISTDIPMEGHSDPQVRVVAHGRHVTPGDEDVTQWRAVSPGYLETFRIALLRGRGFTSDDMAKKAPVAVISDDLARRLWPNEDAIGRRLRTADAPPDEWLEVVGVTSHVRRAYKMGGIGLSPDSQLYVPVSMSSDLSFYLSLRSATDWRAVPLGAVKDALGRIDRSIPLFDVAEMEQVVGEAEWLPRLWMRMFSVFSLMALVLTSLGTYGIVSHAVLQRRQEIGLRMALGAQPREAARIVLRQALSLAAFGMAVGLLLSVATAPLMRVLLHDVAPLHPLVIAAAALVMAGVGMCAAGVPAWRASRIDPMEALRCE